MRTHAAQNHCGVEKNSTEEEKVSSRDRLPPWQCHLVLGHLTEDGVPLHSLPAKGRGTAGVQAKR